MPLALFSNSVHFIRNVARPDNYNTIWDVLIASVGLCRTQRAVRLLQAMSNATRQANVVV